MRRRRLLQLVAAIAVAPLVAGCSGTSSGEGGFVTGSGALTVIAPAQRTAAPLLAGRTLDGAQWSSASAAGVVLVYNVWGSWCAPCRAEAPALVAAARRTEGRARFVGLNTRDADPAPAKAFVRAFGVPYPNLYDPDGRLLLAFAGQLPASAIPTTLVVDAEGRLAARIVGETTEATLVALIEEVAGRR